MNYYENHIFVCTNQKENNKKCCMQGDAENIWLHCRDILKQQQLLGPGKMRVSRSGCLGRCEVGPCLVIYPEGVWYTYGSSEDIDAIFKFYLHKEGDVTHLLL
jgi:(2Fe-2S) ferredoxin